MCAIEQCVYTKQVTVYQLLCNYNQSIVKDTGREGRSNGGSKRREEKEETHLSCALHSCCDVDSIAKDVVSLS